VRTTLALDDDAIVLIQAYARMHDVSMGKAASELIRRGSKFRLAIRMVNDIPVLDASLDFPAISPGIGVGKLDEE
jgi:hypothetical protein